MTPNVRKTLKIAVKTIVGIVVVAATAIRLRSSWNDLVSRGETPTIDWSWFSIAAVAYLLGLLAFGFYYRLILNASAAPIGLLAAERAYLISHLGKYVPGKALVVVMRVGLSTPFGARASTAAVATFYETLVMMAVGGWFALAAAAAAGDLKPNADAAIALGLALIFSVFVEPRVFPSVAKLVSSPIPGVGPESFPRFSYRLLAEGAGIAAVGWLCWGASLTFIVASIGHVSTISFQTACRLAAATAFATVAGFAVPVSPGGLGVRELLIARAATPAIGADRAILAAVLLRLSWIACEVAIGVVALLIRPRKPDPVAST